MTVAVQHGVGNADHKQYLAKLMTSVWSHVYHHRVVCVQMSRFRGIYALPL